MKACGSSFIVRELVILYQILHNHKTRKDTRSIVSKLGNTLKFKQSSIGRGGIHVCL